MTIARRDLLRSGWKLGSTLLAAAAGWTVFESLRPLANAAAKPKIKLGGTAKFAEGTSTYVPQGRFYVTNAGGHLFALSQKCPHLGCRVPFCESSGRFECGCHGSVYDLGGEWIKGPAPRGLDRFALTLEGDVLQVDTGQLTEGPPHGAKTFLTPAVGPSCIEEG